MLAAVGFRLGLIAILPSEPRLVTGVETRFEPIAIDLIRDTTRSMEPGAELRREGHDLAPRIRHNGIGIAPEMLGCLFDPPFRAERRVDRLQGADGIGLSLVRKLAGLHGRTVEAYSRGPGRGIALIVRPSAPADRNETGHEVCLPRSRSA